MKKAKPTNGELEILQIVWDRGPSTVREINNELNKLRDVGYTTTLKLMQIMTTKELLLRRMDGKTHIYRANVNQEKTQGQFLDKIVDTVFQGSASKLVMQALGNKRTTQQELEEIREFLSKMEGGKK